MFSKIKTAKPGKPVDDTIVHNDGDDYLEIIVGYDEDNEPFDFTGMEIVMQIGPRKNFNEDESLFEITSDNIIISDNEDGVDKGVSNVLRIEISDEFFSQNGHFYQYTRLIDAAGKRFTFRGSPFILDN